MGATADQSTGVGTGVGLRGVPDLEEGSGVVVQLFADARSCFDCEHFEEVEDDDGVQSYCPIYEEFIASETYDAEDCPVYTPSNGPRSGPAGAR